MTFEELRVVVVVYTAAILPIIILFNLYLKGQLSPSTLKIYFTTFILCALGWELWFTYGIYAGDPVDIRRSDILNQFIPKNINWLMNSLADAGTTTRMSKPHSVPRLDAMTWSTSYRHFTLTMFGSRTCCPMANCTWAL